MYAIKKVIIIIAILFLWNSLIEGKEAEEVKKAVQGINNAKNVLDKINEVIIKVDPAKSFAKVSKVLVVLGPAMMAVSAVLSNFAIFLPQEDSAELKAINAGFEKVNRKLDVITADIRDLKNFVELSSVKSAYIKYVTSINSNYKILEKAKSSGSKKAYDYFIKQYDKSYNFSANNLYDAMTGKLGPFGFNVVTLYKDYVKCNPVLLSKFCTLGIQTIIKGLSIEGAYLGAHNLSEKVNYKKIKWEKYMKILSKLCKTIIQDCQDNWKTIANQQFREIYKKNLTDNNSEFVKKIAKSLNEVLPQRSWLVVSHKDSPGFSQYGFSSFYSVDKIWKKNKIDVTIFSTPFKEKLKGKAFNELKKKLYEKVQLIPKISDCSMSKWKTDKKVRYERYDFRLLINLIREYFKGGVVYFIRSDLNVAFTSTGSTLLSYEVLWKCAPKKLRTLIFI